MIKVNKLFFFFSLWCFLKEKEKMFFMFLLSYKNTHESLGELKKAVEILVCSSFPLSISCSPKLPLSVHVFYFLNITCCHNTLSCRQMQGRIEGEQEPLISKLSQVTKQTVTRKGPSHVVFMFHQQKRERISSTSLFLLPQLGIGPLLKTIIGEIFLKVYCSSTHK